MPFILIVLLFIVLLLLTITIYFSNRIIYPKTHSHNFSLKKEIETDRLNIEEYNNLQKEEVNIKSPFGYNLYGLFIPVHKSRKAVVMCHGITWTLYGSVKYINMFLKRGFNVLIYDHRNHGKSGGSNTTYGFYEKHDLKACTDWVFEKLGSDCIVGTFGESLGAATALQNTAVDPRLSFCIADCPYSDLAALLKYLLKTRYHLPIFPFLYLAEHFAKLRAGFSIDGVSPVRDVKNVDIPILFIHGKNDLYVPTHMSVDMYTVKKGSKKLYLAPNSAHAESYCNNRKEYEQIVEDFLKENNLI